MSALDHAALCGSEDLIDLLLKHQPDLATQQKSPRTVLYHAAISGHPHITQRLLDLNNDLVNHLDEDDELLPLQKAITLGHDKVVDVIVRRCLKADVKHKALVKGLSCATRQGKASLMELLLDLGVDIDGFDRYKNTALHFAAYNNTVPQVEILIMRKAQLDCRDEDGYTPLMDAARSGSPPSVRLLINAGANLEALTDFGASALDLAIAHGKRECGQLLLARLLQRHPDWFKSSKRDCKPYLQFSVECSALELAQNIIEVVVEKNSKDIDNPSVKQFVSSLLWNKWQAALDFFWNTWDVSTNELGIYGTALHYAAMRYQTSVVETILTHPKHPIDVNNKSGKYGTALQAIVVIQPKANYVEARKFLDMVDLLLKHEADIKVVGKPMTYVLQAALFQRRKDLSLSLLEKLRSKDILRVGGQYQTVLRALLAGPPHGDDVVEELIDLLLDKHGESVSRGTKGANGGGTALHQAAETASVRVIQHLMKLNDKPNVEIDIHQADMMGRLPIHFTIRSSQDRWEIAKTLDPDLATLWEKDQMHRTILHFAAVRRNVVMAKRALEVARDASLDVRKVLNETDIDGWTPIHWACRSGDNDEMIELLTTNGANVDARTRDNWLPWHVAVFHNQNYLRPQGGHDKDEDSDDQESSSDTREGLPTRAAPEIGALCNSCWSNCFGDAWHCTTCTKEHHLIEFDLCFKCYPYKEKLHPADHEFEQMPEDWYWTFRQTKAAMFQDFDKK
ncbi:ankyrin repeat-containing domain protein [Sordaria brevicollis]|uniref:Ankyrin repeat-containing domain protein n=1 Tax=Sordaria brevicollis TaxID=83679 RepID=A0AAE0PJ80_SORBR|nr:ankyrin repeat-containing domain protein [Sordaria brevicollis]